MIASRPFQDAMRGVGRNALDLPVAGLAGARRRLRRLRDAGATCSPSWSAPPACPRSCRRRAAARPHRADRGRRRPARVATFGLVFFCCALLDRIDARRARGRARAPRTGRSAEAAPPRRPSRRAGAAARSRPRATSASRRRRSRPAADAGLAGRAEPRSRSRRPPSRAGARARAAEPGRAGRAASLAELMERLDRASPAAAAPGAPARAAAAAGLPRAADDRLQSAIDSLQRLAARQS